MQLEYPIEVRTSYIEDCNVLFQGQPHTKRSKDSENPTNIAIVTFLRIVLKFHMIRDFVLFCLMSSYITYSRLAHLRMHPDRPATNFFLLTLQKESKVRGKLGRGFIGCSGLAWVCGVIIRGRACIKGISSALL